MFAQRNRLVLPFAILIVIVLSGCVAIAPTASVSASDFPADAQPSPQTVEITVPSPSAEADSLLYMREEEKLAHDVYVALYQEWGMPVFDNIARAESQHMDAVLQELTTRGIADPIEGYELGTFANADLQALYDELVAQGIESMVAALTVGATIEDLDIADLQEALTVTTDDSARWVFENLMSGSENHLRAFVRNLARYGETYTPVYVDAATYDSIVASDGVAGGPQVARGQGRGAQWQR